MENKLENCERCGQNDYHLTEGFYYCNECGAQSQQVFDVHVEVENVDEVRYTKAVKIKKVKAKQSEAELTSYEFFNYILRGLVEELIELGAKRELKLVVLQLWTTYLRKLSIAFFDKKESKLPKIGPMFRHRDIKMLYNQDFKKSRKRPRVPPSSLSSNRSKKSVTRKKRKYLDSEYKSIIAQSLSLSTAFSMSYNTFSAYSFSIGDSSGGIPLEFTAKARKYYKKIMCKSHLSKHSSDCSSKLDCHDLRIPRKLLPHKLMETRLNIRTIFALLYLGLNLVEDDIQLADFRRYLNEGHITSTKVYHMFPENIAAKSEKLLKSGDFRTKRFITTDSDIRTFSVYLCQLIHIPELKTPNIAKLVQRYVTDLCLPQEIALFIERLINLCPPEMRFRLEHNHTPYYEGRAMAYIIFVMKLLFGLDDHKEKAISKSAKKINEKLNEFHCKKKQELFIWEDWRNYIEMRKLIITQCHVPTALAYKVNINPSHYIDRIKIEYGVSEEEIYEKKRSNIQNLEKVFDSFQMIYEDQNADEKPMFQTFKFTDSLTPNVAYFETILTNPPNGVFIPKYMEKDHSILNIKSFIRPKKLRKIFRKNNIQLNVEQMHCNENRNFLNYFRCYENIDKKKHCPYRQPYKVDFKITENDWLDEIKIKQNKRSQNIFDNTTKYKNYEFKDTKAFTDELLRLMEDNKYFNNETNTMKMVNNDDDSSDSSEDGKLLTENLLKLMENNEYFNKSNCSNLLNRSKINGKKKVNQNSQIDKNSQADERNNRSKIKETDEKCKEDENNKEYYKSTKNGSNYSMNENDKRFTTAMINHNISDLQSLRSFDLLSEQDMNPLDDSLLITQPRRISENDDLFADLSEDDTDTTTYDDSINQTFDEQIKLIVSNFDYWSLYGEMKVLPQEKFPDVKHKLPQNFLWLLKTCAEMLDINVQNLYEELLVIENYFIYVLEPIDDMKNMLTFRKKVPKAILNIIEYYRSLW